MAIDVPVDMDNLKQNRSLIDLEGNSEGEFALDDYSLSFLFDDIVLVEMVDEIDDAQGSVIKRGELFIPTNSLTKAWRKGKVVLVGPLARWTKVGNIVVFPNDKGAAVSNLIVEGYGKIGKGMFLNEQRLFGIPCTLR